MPSVALYEIAHVSQTTPHHHHSNEIGDAYACSKLVHPQARETLGQGPPNSGTNHCIWPPKIDIDLDKPSLDTENNPL